MAEFLGIFQIGPVQEFINSARKTQDFWSGSYLLSYLTGIAIDKVVEKSGNEKNVIIYPSLESNNQPIFDYIHQLRKNQKKPWEQGQQPSYAKNEFRPTIPNRFVCKFVLEENKARSILKEAEEAVNKTFFEFADNRVKKGIESKIAGFLDNNNIEFWNNIWKRQTERFFEIYWVIYPLDTEDYRESYIGAELLFGSRKAVRNFNQINEPGYKCTLCGQNEPLNLQPEGSLNRSELKKFWDMVRSQTGYIFREGEHLCAVCTTKRLMANYIFRYTVDFPSTSTFAAADFMEDVITKYQKYPTQFLDNTKNKNLLTLFVNKVKRVAQQERLNFETEPLQKIKKLSEKMIPALSEFSKLDGDWMIEDTYDNIIMGKRVSGENIEELEAAKKSLQLLIEKVKDCSKLTEAGNICAGPGKYYAIFQMDGDNIGEVISGKTSQEEHSNLSERLCGFSAVEIPVLVENQHLGKAVYFGGDEGVAFVSLNDVLAVISECREKFTEKITETTASMGVVIAHHKQSLLQVLAELQKAVKLAKEGLEGKNGFCVSLMKRSGGTSYCLAHWEYKGLKVLPILTELIHCYQENKISDRWYYQFENEKLGLLLGGTTGDSNTINLYLAQLELKRLILRHADMRKIKSGELNQLLEKLEKLMAEIGLWDQFTGLMQIAIYIARGGGR